MNGISRIPASHGQAATDSGENAGERNDVFSRTLSDAMQNEMVQKTIQMASKGLSSGTVRQHMPTMLGTSGLEELILAATVSGEAGDAEIAMLMFCMMMEREMSATEFTPLLGIAQNMLSVLKGGKRDVQQVRSTVLGSDHSPSVLNTVDVRVFGTPVGVALPDEAWKPVNMHIKGSPGNRSAALLDTILDQFNVESAERYRPYRRTGRDTYCNIFLWDVTSTLGAEIPHYVDPLTGNPYIWPDVRGALELDANATCVWLNRHGARFGWSEVSAVEAQTAANSGNPAVTAWHNEGGVGHVQIVCPSRSGGFDPLRGVTIAQAGSRNTRYAHLSSTLSATERDSVRYYVHA